MKKLLFVVPVVALLAAACGGNSAQSPSTSSNSLQQSSQPAAQGQHTVVYSDSGFSPDSVTIKKGESVTFENQSSGGMDVASNPHPTHTDYPEFDQGKSSQSGNSTYTFTFDKVGTWGYHNHFNPGARGTVIVQ